MRSRTPPSPAVADVRLTNPAKVFFPGDGFTKGDMVAYYRDVAAFMLPHLRGRPVTLIRLPDGVGGANFYEKNAPHFTPEWVTRCAVPRRRHEGEIDYIVIDNPATLVWCANLAAIEFHPFLHRAPELDRPTAVAFDLDPGEGADILACVEVAFHLKEITDELGLQTFPKVTGSKGLQIYLPLNTPVGYDETGPFAETIAQLLEERHPDLVVSRMAKVLRRRKVLIDWSQNSPAKTTVCVYSMRAKRDEPFVSFPVEWAALRRAARAGRPQALFFSPAAALNRLRRAGDAFAPVLTLQQQLPRAFRTAALRAGAGPAEALRAYSRKRDFARTAEPPPARVATGRRRGKAETAGAARFVIQKHAASHLHYDFRLEMDGTLKSWAVPKGLPAREGVRRSAFAVEDHPVDYLTFEGTIPKGQYGGGTVMVWDLGTYEIVEGSLAHGSFRVALHGKKLRGEWRMFKIRSEDGKDVWLVAKSGGAMKPLSARREDMSVLTRRSMARIARDRDAVWNSNRSGATDPRRPQRKRRAVRSR